LTMAMPAKIALINKAIPFSFRYLEEPVMQPMYQFFCASANDSVEEWRPRAVTKPDA
jgi:hypothetical protein